MKVSRLDLHSLSPSLESWLENYFSTRNKILNFQILFYKDRTLETKSHLKTRIRCGK